VRKFLLLLLIPAAQAQQAVYKCDQGGKIGYSHEPCVGAKVIDATPTQGVNKMTGTVRKGADVQRDEYHQQLDSAFRPLTGMSHQQMDVERRRYKLPPADKLQCKVLDMQIPSLERQAASATGQVKTSADAELYKARREFYWLKC